MSKTKASTENGWRLASKMCGTQPGREERGRMGWSSQEDLMKEMGFEQSLGGRVGFGCIK